MLIAPRRLRAPADAIAIGVLVCKLCLLVVVFAVAVHGGANAADMAKILHAEFNNAETSFDPAVGWDAASDAIIEHTHDAMLEYEYLARPVRLKPNTLESMPEVSADGTNYLCRVRKGIYFADDPVFAGKRREQADPGERLHQFRSPVMRSTSRSALRRATATTRPRPTTTSEAATAITTSANTCPDCWPR